MQIQRGSLGLLVGLVVSIFVLIFTVVALFMKDSTIDRLKKEVAAKDQQLRDRQQKEVRLRSSEQELNRLIHGSDSPVDRALIQREYIKPAGQRLADVLAKEQWATEDFAKALMKDGQKLTPKQYTNLTEIYSDLFVLIDALVPEIDRFRAGKGQALAEVEQAKQTATKDKAELQAKIEALTQEKGELVNKNLEEAKAFDAEKRRLLEEKEQVLAEKAKFEEAQAIEMAKIASKVSELESRIQEMSEKKRRSLAETDSDGEIVYADQRLGVAWIDLGQRDRLRRGTVFEVFQYVKGGERKKKGHISVRAIEDRMSHCAILDQTDPADPIVKGDYIASPFFDKAKESHFVFVGERLTNERYSEDELIRRIEEIGGRVDKTVTIKTDFVIATENAEQSDEFQKAVQFGVVIMREAELLEYLGR